MSNMYAISENTLTALGDVVRSKTGNKYIISTDVPADEYVYEIDIDTREIEPCLYEPAASYYYYIPIDFKAILGDKYDLTTRFYIECNYVSASGLSHVLCAKANIFFCNEVISDQHKPGTNNQIFPSHTLPPNGEYKAYTKYDKTYLYTYLRIDAGRLDWNKDNCYFKGTFKIWAANDDGLIALNKYTPMEMAEVINGLEIPTIEPVVLTGNCTYTCSGSIASQFIKNFGDKITTNKIINTSNMFSYNTLEYIPFEINIDNTTARPMASMFYYAENLKELPKVNNAYPDGIGSIFSTMHNLREIPEDYFDDWNFSKCQTYAYGSCGSVFNNCYSLRKIPDKLLKELWGIQTSSSYTLYYYLIFNCYAMDEIVGIEIQPSNLTSNVFSNTFHFAHRLKNIIFAMNEDGTAKTATWKSQTVDLSAYVGYVNGNASYVLNHNSGITADKQVTDDATYQALKNDPDWFTCDINYSRYNHDSAVNTINSLPDCSATGTNTIKFKGAAGALTDGGAINTLTEEEIAVATVKGWTVTFA